MASTSLHREVLKWFQGLNLSYSIKDPKRDLMNGFLIAEIFQRYYQGKIQMHSFENSMRLERRQNNWRLLTLFLDKNGIEVPESKHLIKCILDDQCLPSLIKFIHEVYTVLTHKKLTEAPLAAFQHIKHPEEQQSQQFLLKEKGLEKIEMKNLLEQQQAALIHEEDEKQNESASLQNNSMQSSFKKTNFVRNQAKPISSGPEQNYSIDVKSVNVRSVNLTINKLKEKTQQITITNQNNQSKNELSTTNNINAKVPTQETNPKNTMQKKESKLVEKNIYEILNEILLEKLNQKTFQAELKKIQGANVQVIQYFMDNLDSFSDVFCCAYFDELLNQLDTILKFVTKDPNESWKFMNFLFSCLKNVGSERLQFKVQMAIIQQYSQKITEFSAIVLTRTRFVFKEYFLRVLVGEIKSSLNFERKEELIKVIYYFSNPEGQARYEMLQQVKEEVKDMQVFLQCLQVLVKQETDHTEDNALLLSEMLYYAKTYLNSGQTNHRVMALSILETLTELDHELVYQLVVTHQAQLESNTWWECKCLVVLIFSKLIKKIVASDKYQQTHVQVPANNKMFSLDQEMVLQQLRDRVASLATSIEKVVEPVQSELVIKITLLNIIDVVQEHKLLLELFVSLLLKASPETRQWALYSPVPAPEPYEDYLMLSDKSLKYTLTIDPANVHLHADRLLLTVTGLVPSCGVTAPALDLLHFAFKFLDFKAVNIEVVENVANALKEHMFQALARPESASAALFILTKIFQQQFYSEVNIKDSQVFLAKTTLKIYQEKHQACKDAVDELLSGLVSEAFEQGVNAIKHFLQDVYKVMVGETDMKALLAEETKLQQIFQLTVEQMDDQHSEQS